MDENVGIVIGIEAQKSFYPGYDLVMRGIYYAARMLSSQMGVEFTGENYNQIKKVYSIWICMRVLKKIGNTITDYEGAGKVSLYRRKINESQKESYHSF